jgi:hypothetical protein
MSIVYSVPANSNFQKCGGTLYANFNTPGYIGKYAFQGAALNKISFERLQKNCLYLIERYSVSFSLSKDSFFESINDPTELYFKFSSNNENILNRPIKLINYQAESQINLWTLTNKGENFFSIEARGIFDQLPSMVGMLSIKLYIDFTIIEIHDNGYINAWKNGAINQYANELKA